MDEKHEAMFYEDLPGGKVKCFLCPRYCQIAPGKAGYCGVRENDGGKLYSLIYGKASSVAVDPIEKKPLFHFHPGSSVLSLGTWGCNMRCIHCQNWQISHAVMVEGMEQGKVYNIQAENRTEYISPERLMELAEETGAKGIAFTYNEPTIWFEYAYDCFKLAKQRGLYTAFITNGYITAEALDIIIPYLDAYRVDIKGFTNTFYKKLAQVSDFQPILRAAVQAKKTHNVHVECITLIIPHWNDDEKQLRDMAKWIKENLGAETPWHVTRFVPYLELKDLHLTPVETLEWARKIGMEEGLKYVYIGNVPGHEGENTHCPKCKNILIQRMGYEITVNNLKGKTCGNCGEKIDIIGRIS
ncbi:AmmeMemoRadiSam system radical SAM enzyme [Candidatus Margulisiibacteriota bacterium]